MLKRMVSVVGIMAILSMLIRKIINFRVKLVSLIRESECRV